MRPSVSFVKKFESYDLTRSPRIRARVLAVWLIFSPLLPMIAVALDSKINVAYRNPANYGLGALSMLCGVYMWKRGERWPLVTFEILSAIACIALTGTVWVVSQEEGTGLDLTSLYCAILIINYLMLPLRRALRLNVVVVLALGVKSQLEAHHYSSMGSWLLSAFWMSAVGYTVGVLSHGHRRAVDRLEYVAATDELTGLANRSWLRNEALAQLEKLAAKHPVAGILLIDLDRFKDVNDSHGHRAGDVVLQTTAQRFQSVAGSEATVVRLGGDEFAIIAGGAEDALGQLADAIVELTRQEISIGPSTTVAVGASVGVARFPSQGESVDQLLHSADSAMYAAKAQKSSSRMQRKSDHRSLADKPSASAYSR